MPVRHRDNPTPGDYEPPIGPDEWEREFGAWDRWYAEYAAPETLRAAANTATNTPTAEPRS